MPCSPTVAQPRINHGLLPGRPARLEGPQTLVGQVGHAEIELPKRILAAPADAVPDHGVVRPNAPEPGIRGGVLIRDCVTSVDQEDRPRYRLAARVGKRQEAEPRLKQPFPDELEESPRLRGDAVSTPRVDVESVIGVRDVLLSLAPPQQHSIPHRAADAALHLGPVERLKQSVLADREIDRVQVGVRLIR